MVAPQYYKRGIRIAAQLLAEPEAAERLSGTGIFEEYFVRLYTSVNLDEKDVDSVRRDLNYPEVSRRYRFIEPTGTVRCHSIL